MKILCDFYFENDVFQSSIFKNTEGSNFLQFIWQVTNICHLYFVPHACICYSQSGENSIYLHLWFYAFITLKCFGENVVILYFKIKKNSCGLEFYSKYCIVHVVSNEICAVYTLLIVYYYIGYYSDLSLIPFVHYIEGVVTEGTKLQI